jgi:very-short-patch-repair endonuclease
VAAAVSDGRIVRDARGRYALPTADEARRAANRLMGVVTGPSAAAAHGWETRVPPPRPDVTVPAKRRVTPERRRGVDLHWRDIDPDDVWDGILRAGPAVIDCAKRLPFDEALAIADSALRHGNVTPQGLVALARQVPTTGRRQSLRVAHEASELAANPFESVLRAISLDVPGLDLRPQVVIEQDGWVGRPDLVDVERRIVVEADSFEFHGHRKALKRDCERYNALNLRGWVVLRFSWEHAMHEPDYVRHCLFAVASTRTVRQVAPGTARRPSAWERERPVLRTRPQAEP